MRFQALMPDVLHWLGIKKVDKMVSMSDMKYDAIVKSGIEIWKRYDIPGEYHKFGWLYSCSSSSMPSVIRCVYLTDPHRPSYPTRLARGDRRENCCWVFLEW